MKFTAVAFDLDGTLYANSSLNIRLVPFLLKDLRLLNALDKARRYLRSTGAYEDNFYETQARLMGDILNLPAEKAMEKAERLIYRGWEPLFKKINLFPYVRETLDSFRKAGITIGLLSDFPPEKKLENLKISAYFDAVLCSEDVGRLKPDSASFLELAGMMGTDPEGILYVGNSLPYDVVGASGVGMKTALVKPGWKKLPFIGDAGVSGRSKKAGHGPRPDFTFYDYRQLRDYVLS